MSLLYCPKGLSDAHTMWSRLSLSNWFDNYSKILPFLSGVPVFLTCWTPDPWTIYDLDLTLLTVAFLIYNSPYVKKKKKSKELE